MTFSFAKFRTCAVLATAALINFSAFAASDVEAAPPAEKHWALVLPTVTHHQQRTHSGKPYNEEHYGLGLEYRTSAPHLQEWQMALGGMALRDSFDKPSAVMGVSLTRDVISGEHAALRAGVNAGIARKHRDWDGPLQWVPYAGPEVSLRALPCQAELGVSYYYQRNKNTGNSNGVFLLSLKVPVF